MHLPYDTADACQGGFRKNNDRCVCRFPEYRTDCDGNGKSIKCIRGQCICQYGFDAGILEFVSCNATYGGGGGSISVASDSFSVTLKAISAGKASISLSATDGVIYGTEEELDSMAGSSTSVTVKNEAAGSNGNAGNEAVLEQEVTTILEAIRQLYPQIIP